MAEKKPNVIEINGKTAYQIPNFDPCYFLTEDGNVYSTKKGQPKRLTGVIGRNGYRAQTFRRSGKCVREYVHRLMAEQFCVKPDGCNVVNHIDGNKLNNLPENLEWVTRAENVKHAYSMGLMADCDLGHIKKIVHLSHSRSATFTKEDADKIVEEYHSMSEPQYAAIAKRLGCGTETIRRIVLGRQKIFKEIAA